MPPIWRERLLFGNDYMMERHNDIITLSPSIVHFNANTIWARVVMGIYLELCSLPSECTASCAGICNHRTSFPGCRHAMVQSAPLAVCCLSVLHISSLLNLIPVLHVLFHGPRPCFLDCLNHADQCCSLKFLGPNEKKLPVRVPLLSV